MNPYINLTPEEQLGRDLNQCRKNKHHLLYPIFKSAKFGGVRGWKCACGMKDLQVPSYPKQTIWIKLIMFFGFFFYNWKNLDGTIHRCYTWNFPSWFPIVKNSQAKILFERKLNE